MNDNVYTKPWRRLLNPFQFFKAILFKSLAVLAYNSFISPLNVSIHRFRGAKIGKAVAIGRCVIIDDYRTDLVLIEDGVALTTGSMILTHKRNLIEYNPEKAYYDYPFKLGQVIIRENAQIGIRSIILPGVTVGRSAIVAAGSVVTKNVPDFTLVAGVPAKVIKKLT